MQAGSGSTTDVARRAAVATRRTCPCLRIPWCARCGPKDTLCCPSAEAGAVVRLCCFSNHLDKPYVCLLAFSKSQNRQWCLGWTAQLPSGGQSGSFERASRLCGALVSRLTFRLVGGDIETRLAMRSCQWPQLNCRRRLLPPPLPPPAGQPPLPQSMQAAQRAGGCHSVSPVSCILAHAQQVRPGRHFAACQPPCVCTPPIRRSS